MRVNEKPKVKCYLGIQLKNVNSIIRNYREQVNNQNNQNILQQEHQFFCGMFTFFVELQQFHAKQQGVLYLKR